VSTPWSKGPWRRRDSSDVVDATGERVHFAGLRLLMNAGPEDNAQAEANTRLALAAPRLVDALEAALAVIRMTANESSIPKVVLEFGELALAEARGEVK
jgi:hypothetical protein